MERKFSSSTIPAELYAIPRATPAACILHPCTSPDILRKKGIAKAAKRGDRETSEGVIKVLTNENGRETYILEVNAETDFVARTEVFKKFAKDVAMQIAACGAKYLKKEDVPAEALAKAENADEYKKQFCLMEQPFVKDSKLTMAAYLQDVISQTGENVVIRRFTRFSLGAEE